MPHVFPDRFKKNVWNMQVEGSLLQNAVRVVKGADLILYSVEKSS